MFRFVMRVHRTGAHMDYSLQNIDFFRATDEMYERYNQLFPNLPVDRVELVKIEETVMNNMVIE